MNATLATAPKAAQPSLPAITINPFRWRVPDPFQHLLFDERGLRLSQWLDAGQAEVVKKGPHREVYRVTLPELCFYVKHNLLHNYRAWLRQLVRPSKARMEFEKLRELANRGIPTIEALGYGERLDGITSGESYLITRALDDTQQFDEFLEQTLPNFSTSKQTQVRQQLPRSLGKFVARLHLAGVVHQDFHCGNILIRWTDDEPRLYLIDLQAVRLQKPLSWIERQQNLVILNRWLSLRTNRAERCRFWRTYLEEIGGNSTSGNSRELARGLEQKTRESNLQFWQRRDRRCRFRNRRYRLVCAKSFRGYSVSDLSSEDAAKILADPDAMFRDPNRKVLKESRSVKVIEIKVQVGVKQIPAVFKRVEVRKWSDPLASLARWSPVLRSWVYGHGLRERGLPTARPLMMFHRMAMGMAREGYLLMEKVENSGDVRDLVSQLAEESAHQVLRERTRQLARLIRDLHDRGFVHRDLKTSNILVCDVGEKDIEDGRPFAERKATLIDKDNGYGTRSVPTTSGHGIRSVPTTSGHGIRSVPTTKNQDRRPFCFIDLVGLARVKNPSCEIRGKNLVRLAACFVGDLRVTRTDYLRFLREYMRWGLHGKGDWKKWWRAVEAGLVRKVEKNHRRGRPLV